MPTYAYACSACEHAFDARQSFSDLPLTTCPRCEQETLRKLFSPVGVVFKGSGFYRNDSRAAAHSKGGAAEKTGEKPGERTGEKTGDKTPAPASGGGSNPAGTAGSTSSKPTAGPSAGGSASGTAAPAGA